MIKLTSNLSMNSLIPSLSPVKYLAGGAIVSTFFFPEPVESRPRIVISIVMLLVCLKNES